MTSFKEIRRELRRRGYRVVRAKSGHWKAYDDNRLLVVMPASTSDVRAVKNCLALLRRRGILEREAA